MAITVKEAQTLYVSYFGRPADFVGLQYWTGTETLVGSLEQLAHSFYNSAEGKKYFPVDPATNQIDVTASINAIYANMFGRVPETAGFDYWYNEIASGKINLAEAAVAIYKGAQGKDALMIENKIAAATQFTDQVAASNQPSLYYGEQAFAKANEFLNTVTDVTDVTSAGFAAQVNAAVNVAEAAGAVTGEGGTFKLDVDPTLISAGGTLTNEVNVGFKPEGKYLTAGNDVIELYEWDGTRDVIISDIFSNDNDKVSVLAERLSPDATAGTGGKLKLTAVENLEIISSVPSSVKLTGANFKGLESIELKGDITTLNVSDFTYGVKIDATENADNISGGTKADTINGGAGNDIIQGNQGNDVLTGGNGADTFIVGNAKDFGVDQILDFSAEDKISMNGFVPNELKKFDASTFSTVNYKTLDSVLATFGPGGANVTKNGDVVIFSYDGKTYALLAKDAFTEAGSALVDITGANVASLTESNFGEASASGGGSGSGTLNFQLYSKFKEAVDTGTIKEGQTATIQSMTGTEAATLLTDASIDKYLAKIADGGIKAITGDITINSFSYSNFDASKLDAKLADSISGVKFATIKGTTNSGDKIIASKLGGTIDGSGGTTGAPDEITLNAGKDTVVFSVTANNKETNITNFNTNADKLQFSKTTYAGLNNASTLTELNATGVAVSAGKIYVGTKEQIESLKTSGGTNVYVAIVTSGNAELGNIYTVTDKSTANQDTTLALIGSIDNVAGLSFANFDLTT